MRGDLSSALGRPSVIVGLVVLAFLLRVAFLLLAGVHAPLTGDELAYQQIAENFAAGHGLYQTNNPFFPDQALYAWQAPLYPLALGILYQLFGVNILIAQGFGIFVSTATVYVMYDVARRVFAKSAQSQSIAFVAAFLVAIYPGLLTNAHLLLSETLFILFLLLAFDFAARALDEKKSRVWLWILGAGAAWGLMTLTRGITLYFTPVFALWLVWAMMDGRQRTTDDGRRTTDNQSVVRRPSSAVVLGGVLFLLATVAVIVPWTVRNYLQFHQVVLLETKGGVNLWLGNSPYTPPDFIRNVWKVGVREPMLNGLPTDEIQRDRAAYALALNYMRAEPLTFLAHIPIKFADFASFERNLIDTAEATRQGEGWNSPAKVGADLLAMVAYIFVVLCGIAGFVFAPTNRWKILLLVFVAYFLAAHLVIFGDGRFHLPLIPLFALYAAWLLVCRRQIVVSPLRVALTLIPGILCLLVWGREILFAWQILGKG